MPVSTPTIISSSTFLHIFSHHNHCCGGDVCNDQEDPWIPKFQGEDSSFRLSAMKGDHLIQLVESSTMEELERGSSLSQLVVLSVSPSATSLVAFSPSSFPVPYLPHDGAHPRPPHHHLLHRPIHHLPIQRRQIRLLLSTQLQLLLLLSTPD